MRATRERLAQQAESEGIAEASRIRNQAQSQRETIMSFAREQGATIRAEGVAAAAEVYKQFQADESFARFLREMRALESMLQQKTTFLIDTATEPFSRLRDPGAVIDPPKLPASDESPTNQ
jgi:regulator of protease activity HflC (stomatin/prohibitin superfamily)